MLNRLLHFILIVLIISIPSVEAQDIYGLAKQGGLYNLGCIYRTDSIGNNLSISYSFPTPVSKNEGENPNYSELCLSTQGLMYGITTDGGQNNRGSIFMYDPSTDTIMSCIFFHQKHIRSDK